MSDIIVKKAQLEDLGAIITIHNVGFSYWISKFGITYGYKTISLSDANSWLLDQDSDLWVLFSEIEVLGMPTALLRS